MDRIYLTAQALLENQLLLAYRIHKDGVHAQFIVGIWRGAAPVGIAVQEYLQYRHREADHIAVRNSSYYGINKRSKKIRVRGLHYLIENANASDRLLIIDDVLDSSRSVDAQIEAIRKTVPHEYACRNPRHLAVVQAVQERRQVLTGLLPARERGVAGVSARTGGPRSE